MGEFLGGGNSPIVGVLSSVLSLITKNANDLLFTPSFKTLLIVQNSYIITIFYSSYLSGKIVSRVQYRSGKFTWPQLILPSCSSVFTFGLLSAAFIEYGHLSFILSVMFGLSFIYSQTNQEDLAVKNSISNLDYLRILGFGLAWWPMLPISCSMIICLFYWNYKESRDKSIKSLQRFIAIPIVTFALVAAYFAYRSVFKTGFSFSWPTQSDGGVLPLNGQLVILLIILIFLTLISPLNKNFSFPISRFGRLFFIMVIVFFGFLRITNEINVGYQSYGSRKTLFLLFVLTVPLFFYFFEQSIKRVTAPLESFIICLGALLIMLSSTIGFRYFKEPSTGNSSTGYAEYLTNALDRNPSALILCVNSDPLQADLGYYCNRMASALTFGDSSLSFNWGQAMLNPDKTPFGNVIPLSETFGERAKVGFVEMQNTGTQDVKILIFPPLPENVADFLWDEGRWWLNEIDWSDYLANTK